MIDEALNYVGTVISKIKDIYSPLNLKDLSANAGSSKKLLHEYEIISRNSNMDRTSDGDGKNEEDNEDECCYAVARSFPIIHQAVDAVSTSEPEFPKLFHQQDDSATSESCSLIQSVFMQQDPLYADWLVNDSRPSAEVQNVYRKVATWVFAQQRFMHRTDHDEDDDNDDGDDDLQYNDYYITFYNGGCKGNDDVGGGGGIFMDEMEMIDPIDLFDESLLSDFLLLTRSSSEKRILLREFAHYKYNMLTVREATKSCEGSHYLKKPDKEACFEMSEILRGQNGDTQCEEKQRFLTIDTVLEDYACYDQEGVEISASLSIDDAASCSSEGSSVKDDGDAENKELRSNDLDIVSYHCSEVMQQNITSDDCTSVTYPTDVIDITSALVPEIISVSDDNESDVWEDARAIPHWLDFETDDHLFTQPHRPFYYYRDRIKGCYRIIGVEDEPVILFSGNDDDSIFYGCENEQRNVRDISALRRSHSLGMLNSSIQKTSDTSPPKSFIANQLNIAHVERRNDSGIEDVEDSVVDETLTETALSARECHEMGRITRVIRTKEPKTVTFKLENSRPLFYDYLFVVFAALCVICSVISYFLTIQT